MFKDDHIPADILVLSSSEPNSICYVETKNLDGETNLKICNGYPIFKNMKTASDCHDFEFYIETEKYSPNLTSFTGKIVFPKTKTKETTILPINLNNILLRGCVLRNTEWIIGFVIGTEKRTEKSPTQKTTICKIFKS